jgi:outer membrane murein-binding lipoprotein Lpp
MSTFGVEQAAAVVQTLEAQVEQERQDIMLHPPL